MAQKGILRYTRFMLNKKIAINGEPWCRGMTGIERVAIEVTEALDALAAPGEIELIVPANAQNVPAFQNIQAVRLNCTVKSFPRWTQGAFQQYVLRSRAVSLNFSNTCPILAPGIEFLHDIYCKLHPEDFTSLRDKLVRSYSTLMYRTIAKRARRIITVSEYSKKTIAETYRINPDRIGVIYAGIGKYTAIQPDFSILNRLPQLADRPFYFTLGSLAVRKNLKWIADHAELYPAELFAVSGSARPDVIPQELQKLRALPNVIMTGYLSDAEAKALLSKCRAFIFPSYFEGFGIPPLEALSCGAPIIISNAASLPEIYGNAAHYIEPDAPAVNLDELLKEPVEPPDELLEKYTLKNSAVRLYKEISSL